MWYRVVQKRSVVGLPKRIRQIAQRLGLNKRGSIAYCPVNELKSGQILSLKELLDVQIVDQPLTRNEERLLKRRPAGFTIENKQSE